MNYGQRLVHGYYVAYLYFGLNMGHSHMKIDIYKLGKVQACLEFREKRNDHYSKII